MHSFVLAFLGPVFLAFHESAGRNLSRFSTETRETSTPRLSISAGQRTRTTWRGLAAPPDVFVDPMNVDFHRRTVWVSTGRTPSAPSVRLHHRCKLRIHLW
ncbi:hypothetical protein QBC43DRAFT_320425 [Cladorrhinum sp. PSN259]|nr:hypothetical protein QBC43DRAFT_320425 [Cladorrhinum sp. PSN259]